MLSLSRRALHTKKDGVEICVQCRCVEEIATLRMVSASGPLNVAANWDFMVNIVITAYHCLDVKTEVVGIHLNAIASKVGVEPFVQNVSRDALSLKWNNFAGRKISCITNFCRLKSNLQRRLSSITRLLRDCWRM
jgi:hypothetical protein